MILQSKNQRDSQLLLFLRVCTIFLKNLDVLCMRLSIYILERHMSQPICYHENLTQLKQDCNK